MLILSIGDFHIPERATEVPFKFRKLLSSSSSANKIQKVLCLGNVTSSPSTLEWVKSISSDFELIKGEFDHDMNLPLSLVFKCESFKIGVVSGFTIIPQNDPLSLLTQARMMDVDILIWGGSSKVEAYTLDGKFFINLGSATGLLNFNELEKEDLEIIEAELQNIEKSHADKQDDVEQGNSVDEVDDNEDKEGKEEENSEKGEQDKDQDEDEDLVDEIASKVEVDLSISDKEITEEQLNLLEELISPVPSFCLLDVKGSLCVTYIYTLIENEVKIDKINYRKE